MLISLARTGWWWLDKLQSGCGVRRVADVRYAPNVTVLRMCGTGARQSVVAPRYWPHHAPPDARQATPSPPVRRRQLRSSTRAACSLRTRSVRPPRARNCKLAAGSANPPTLLVPPWRELRLASRPTRSPTNTQPRPRGRSPRNLNARARPARVRLGFSRVRGYPLPGEDPAEARRVLAAEGRLPPGEERSAKRTQRHRASGLGLA
eukprot:scaffold571_cov364-Prasinococcus_capsulatus_cf.AAC.7